MKRYNIAYLTSIDPRNKGALSGSSYYILQALASYVGKIDILGPVNIHYRVTKLLVRIAKKIPRPYNFSHSYFFALKYARAFTRKMKGKQYDFIFAARSSTEIALLKTDVPIVFYSDTTFKLFYNYYDWFSNFMKISEIEGNSIERRAINKSAIVIFSSEWAAKSAIDFYNVPPEKVHVIPFGPNVDNIPSKESTLKNKDRETCKLLFIGVEWDRKGGEVAFDTLIALKKMGLKTTLTVIGCVPPEEFIDDDLIVIPFLNKNILAESRRFNALFEESHFLILPTKQECFGVVFCEASAFGLPSLTTDTGGISGAVKNGVNGYRFEVTQGGEEYAKKAFSIFTDYDNKYIPLSISSRGLYDSELNWSVFASAVKKLMDDYLEKLTT